MVGRMTYGFALALSKVAVVGLLATPAFAETEVLALGDSLTQGYGLPVEQGFVPQLENWLETQGLEVRVVNGGVSGDTTAGGLSRVEWSLTPDTEIMIVTLGGNDLLRGLAPEMARSNIEGILKVAEARNIKVLLVGMEAPGNYGPDYKQAFDDLYPELAQAYGTAFFPRFFEGIMVNGDTPEAVQPFMQADGIHPNAEGVTMIVEAIGPTVAELFTKE